MCDGENRTRDRDVATYWNGGPRSMLMPSRTRRVVYSSLELMEALPPNSLSSHMITLALSN